MVFRDKIAAGNVRAKDGAAISVFRDEIPRLEKRLKKLGVDETKVGVELEFKLKPTNAVSDRWQRVRQEVIEELRAQLPSADADTRRAIETKIGEVSKFNAQEVLMCDLIERDPRTKPLLESSFGTTKDGDGYYDAAHWLEIKLKYTDPTSALRNRDTVVKVLSEKAKEYGLSFPGITSQHSSFSFWAQGKNLLDYRHPEYATKGKAIAEGVTFGIYENLPLALGTFFLDKRFHIPLAMTADRENMLRMTTDRFEWRPPKHADQDSNAIVPLVMASAAYGLSDNRKSVKAHTARKPIIHHARDQQKLLAHLLSNSTVNQDRTLNIPKSYVMRQINDFKQELGMDTTTATENDILDFVKRIRIEPEGQGYAIRWPEPPVSLPVDVPVLDKALRCTGVADIHVVSPGYHLNEGPVRTLAGERLKRTENSAVLNAFVSPEFKRAALDRSQRQSVPAVS